LKFVAIPIRTKYWRPGDDFMRIIVQSVAGLCEDEDIVVVSEKALSVALGQIVDESHLETSFTAVVLTKFWMRIVWGYVLGRICHLNRRTVWRLRYYPLPDGAAHKQLTIRQVGLRQSLLYYSEGGIDLSNLPYSFAALPLANPELECERLLNAITNSTKKRLSVMIVDTDKTYTHGKMYLTPRPAAIKGIKSLGVVALIVGRALRWNARATPLAVCGRGLSVEEALTVADAADKARGHGAGRTVWDMARRFGVGLREVTWEMIEQVPHRPIVLIRKTD
jgi:F420-0:gamma-glutamyl ligase-like protein